MYLKHILFAIVDSENVMDHIIFATDSRGAKLKHFLMSNTTLTLYTVHTIIIPGAKIETLTQAFDNKLRKIFSSSTSVHHVFVIVAAGICNLTEKIHHANGTEIVYISDLAKTSHILEVINSVYKTYNSSTVSCKLVHIPPVSLISSSQFNMSKRKLTKSMYTYDQISQQQIDLENDINEINSLISSLNERFSKHSVRWDRDLLICKTKKRGKNGQNKHKIKKFSYSLFYDGVHPQSSLATKWYTYMCESVVKDLNPAYESDSSEEHDTWDFKRLKLQ